MFKFDTKVQFLKYKVLKEVAVQKWNDTLAENIIDIPKIISPGNHSTMRCCVYKERAILHERVKLAIGNKKDKIIQVLDIACDECPVSGYEVTESCRGCLAHRCESVCKRGAITFDENHVAKIDKTKCVECGLCAKVCPFSAIINRSRPCLKACKMKAISVGENKAAKIDYEKCVSCGACVYQCPFGAISDVSCVTTFIDMVKQSEKNSKYKMIAIIAPAIASQFKYAKLGQVVTGLRELGFSNVYEVAHGADIAAANEALELSKKGFLISSCCPAFVKFVKREFPDLEKHISHNMSPMAITGKLMKEHFKDCKVVFVGPCIGKKEEKKNPQINEYVDIVMTFEELQALFDSKNIDITTLAETEINDASSFGRKFAKTGGLTESIKQALIEKNIDFDFKPIVCNGLEECRKALIKAKNKVSDFNFVEGMACINGCVGGSGCINHDVRNITEVIKYADQSKYKNIEESLNDFKLEEK